MELPKFILGDNTDLPNAIFIIHTEFPRFIINLENDEIEWLEEFDENDEKELLGESEHVIKEASEFYDRELARISSQLPLVPLRSLSRQSHTRPSKMSLDGVDGYLKGRRHGLLFHALDTSKHEHLALWQWQLRQSLFDPQECRARLKLTLAAGTVIGKLCFGSVGKGQLRDAHAAEVIAHGVGHDRE